MSFVISNEVLSTLICSKCGKYLSVNPVKIYPNAKLKCGRCSMPDDDGVLSLFGNISQCGLFPCINRYEGCNRYLTCSEVVGHEKNCVPGLYICPLCDTNALPAYQFPEHYKVSHSDRELRSASFFVDINSECNKCLFYRENNCLYTIYARKYINEMYLLLNASLIGPEERCKNIKQKVKIYTLHEKLLVETKSRPCTTVGSNSVVFRVPLSKLIYKESNIVHCSFTFDTSELNNFTLLPDLNLEVLNISDNNNIKGLHNKYPEIYLSPEFKEEYPNFYLSPCKTKLIEILDDKVTKVEFPRICNFCENIFPISGDSNNIYKCKRNHYVCDSCFGYNSDCCDGPYSYAERVSEIYSMLYFFCKWNCNRFYCGQDLKFHETRCRNNLEIFLRPEQIGRKYFGDKFSLGNNCLTKSHNVFIFHQIVLDNISKIFVITRDNFNFILHCLKDKEMLRFWFTHEYKNEYYVLVHIKEKHLPIYTRVNTFSLDPNNRNIIFFSVVLRKIL